MNNITSKIDSLKAPVDGFGFIIWLTCFQSYTLLQEHKFLKTADFINGYTFGFSTAL